jgi:hypothetical protein
MTVSSLPLHAGDWPTGDYDRAPEFNAMARILLTAA